MKREGTLKSSGVDLNHLEYKWVVLSVTTIGALMAAIDSTIVILGLPDIMVDLHADLVAMIWVIMGYILVSTVFLLTFGRVADMLGRVRMYNLGFVVFTIGSALCGLSANATQLILFRLVQGSGGAMMVVNSVAILTEVFPAHERGRALGINAVTVAGGHCSQPAARCDDEAIRRHRRNTRLAGNPKLRDRDAQRFPSLVGAVPDCGGDISGAWKRESPGRGSERRPS